MKPLRRIILHNLRVSGKIHNLEQHTSCTNFQKRPRLYTVYGRMRLHKGSGKFISETLLPDHLHNLCYSSKVHNPKQHTASIRLQTRSKLDYVG